MAGNLLLFAFLALFGPGDVGTTAFPLLKVPVGPRACAMGETHAGFAPDVNVLFSNPAGLGWFKAAQLGISHQDWFLRTRDEHLAASLPAGPGCIGAGLVYSGTDGIETWDPENNRGDTASLKSGYALLGYGMTLARRLTLGLTLKGLYDRLTRRTGTGACADIGILYRLTPRLNLGLTGQNLGPAMRYGDESYPLPAALRAGVGYALPRLRLALDASAPIDNYPSLHLGAEYDLSRLLALRGGARLGPHDWQTLSWTSLFTAGAGLNLDRLHLDYALVPYGPLGLTHRLGLRFDFQPNQFGQVRIRIRESQTNRPLRARFRLSGVQQGESMTDADGTFLLTGVETGWLRVAAVTDDHNPTLESLFVEPMTTCELNLALSRAGHGSLWAAVYDAATRRTLAASVTYTGPASGRVRTDGIEGSITLRKLPAGDYEFTVVALDSIHLPQSAVISVKPTQLTSHTFLLERAGTPAPMLPDSSAALPVAPDSIQPAPIPQDAPRNHED